MKKIVSLFCCVIFSLFCSIALAGFVSDPTGHIANVGAAGGLDVSVQDQTTPVFIVPMHTVLDADGLAVQAVPGERTVTLADATGFVDGSFLVFVDEPSRRYGFYHQVGAAAGNVITLDSPIDFAYTTATVVHRSSKEMAINGSVTPVTFGIRQGEPPDPTTFPTYIDITRIIVTCTTTTAVDLNKFCSLAELTNGLVIRVRNGLTYNLLNIKTNLGWTSVAYDFTVYQASNPIQGIDGFASRLTFGGQEKLGVVIRIGPGDDLEAIVQDDLSGLTTFNIVAEGHVVQPD